MKYISILILLTCLSAFSQNWQRVPEIGTGTYVHSIFYPKSNPNKVIVLADSIPVDKDMKDMFKYFALLDGYGYFISNDGGNTFPTQKKFGNKVFLSITESNKNPNYWIASTVEKNISKIGVSEDEGETWDFESSSCNTNAKILNFINVANDIVGGAVGTGFGLINGGDYFSNCNQNDTLNASIRDIKRLDNKIYIASDDNAKQGVFFSSDLGSSWTKDVKGLEGIRVNTVSPSPAYAIHRVVVCGGDKYVVDQYLGSGIYYSSDNGANWTLQGAANSVVYDIKYHPKDPLLMLAACGKSGLFISTNGGVSWEQNNGNLPENSDVRFISFPDKEKGSNGFSAYVGIYDEGLYKTDNLDFITTSVEQNQVENKLKISPNPFLDNFDLYFSSQTTENVEIKIYDLQGIEVFKTNKFTNIGENYINISNLDLSSGVYIVNINTSSGVLSQKLIKK